MITESKEEFKERIKRIASRIIDDHEYIRLGQAVFNLIDEMYGVARITQFKYGIDCFYNDNMIDNFIDKCYEIIKTEKNND